MCIITEHQLFLIHFGKLCFVCVVAFYWAVKCTMLPTLHTLLMGLKYNYYIKESLPRMHYTPYNRIQTCIVLRTIYLLSLQCLDM